MANEILFEQQVCTKLNIPSIPKREWDCKSSFKFGVAVVGLDGDRQAYAIATFDNKKDSEPRIIKVFTLEQFNSISKVFIVPDYMDDDVDKMDLDDESKRAAKALLEEAAELENEGSDDETAPMPENEYFFDHIHNDDEAAAFIKDFNKRNRIKGRVPTSHDGLVMRLSVIYSETQNKKSKK